MSEQVVELELGRMETHHFTMTNKVLGFLSKQQQYGLAIIIVSAVSFRLIDDFLGYLLRKYASSHLSRTLKKKEKAEYKFKNYFMSTLHAIITSSWAILSLYQDPGLWEVIHPATTTTFVLVCFSTGYFIHDSYHLVANDNSRASMEVLPHHVIVIVSFLMALCMERFLSLCTIALLVEVNSVFLHGRRLLIIAQHPSDSPLFRVNSIVNVDLVSDHVKTVKFSTVNCKPSTFVVFRMGAVTWLCVWLALNPYVIPMVVHVITCLGLFLTFIMNLILLWRVVYSDFIKVRKVRKVENNNEDKKR